MSSLGSSKQPETWLERETGEGLGKPQRAVMWPLRLVLASLGRDTAEDVGPEGDAGLCTLGPLSPAFRVMFTKWNRYSVGKTKLQKLTFLSSRQARGFPRSGWVSGLLRPNPD